MPPSTRRKRSVVESEEEKDEISPRKNTRYMKEVVDDECYSAAEKTIDNDENHSIDESSVKKESQDTESVHDENESEMEEIITNQKSTSRRRSGFRKSALTGIIQRISVENFMCHRKLTVDLCPNGTFQEIKKHFSV
jgi:structural maintenance of chromosomes protein 6